MNYDDKFQLMIMGDSMVGKTSLLYQYQENKFMSNYLATCGIDFFTKEESFGEKKVRIKIWDTAGQERFKSLTQAFSRNADGIILVFDVTSRETFLNLKFWIACINSSLGENNFLPKIIIGNKIDMEKEVQKSEAENFAEINKCIYFETSAKLNIGVNEAIRHLVSKLLEQKNAEYPGRLSKKESTRLSKLDPNVNIKREKSKRCAC